MRVSSIFIIFISLALIAQPYTVMAFETDQYNLPHTPLADIGDEVAAYVEQNFRRAIENVNNEIGRHKLCAETISERPKGCGPVARELEELKRLRSNAGLAKALYDLLAGDGFTTTKFGGWMYSHKFRAQPDRYKTSYATSIYILNPPNYLTISPTVRLYGIEFGIDKLEHFFQQGHQYYEIMQKGFANGGTRAEAVKQAIDWGKKTERTYYGLLTSGVYSNADLYANYAGLRFYEGLTEPTQLGSMSHSPLAVLDNGYWKMNPKYARDNLLKPFISDHMNEALNPSGFRLTLVRSVRRAVKRHACEDWRKTYPALTKASLEARTKSLGVWHGEDYGHTAKSRTVTIAEECLQ